MYSHPLSHEPSQSIQISHFLTLIISGGSAPLLSAHDKVVHSGNSCRSILVWTWEIRKDSLLLEALLR